MHRHHIRVLVTALLMLLAAEGLTAVAEPRLGSPQVWPTDALQHKSEQIAAAGHRELVILGSSAAAFGVDPEVMTAATPGHPLVYNAGVPYGRPEVMSVVYERLVSPLLEPRYAIVELLPHTNLPTPDEGFYEALIDSVGVRSTDDGPSLLKFASRSALFRNRPTLRDPVLTLRALVRDTQTSIEGMSASGFMTPPDDTFRFDSGARSLLASMLGSVTDEDLGAGLEELNRLLDSIEQTDAEPALLIMPVYDEVYFSVDAGIRAVWETFLESVRQMAAERGIAILDPRDLGWVEADFVDPTHLSRRGAERLSRWLANEVGRLLDAPEG
ncbi:MAG: hypothetical protein OEO77_04810 [Acidimicrobiia bacterium]|nr:hypothetical protein [Acidimicrobiia bacterium]